MTGAVGLSCVLFTSWRHGDCSGTCEPSYAHSHYFERNKDFCFREFLITRTPYPLLLQAVKKHKRTSLLMLDEDVKRNRCKITTLQNVALRKRAVIIGFIN